MTAIKKEWKVQAPMLGQELLIVLGAFLLGKLLNLLLVVTSDMPKEAPLGSVFGFIGVAVVLFCIGGQFVLGLNNAVLMSRTRKGFLLGHYTVSILWLLICFLFALALCVGEVWLTSPSGSQELEPMYKFLSVVLHPAVFAAFLLGGVVLANFVGALLARFGKKAFWVLWAAWMFFFLVLPRMMSASEGKDTILTRVGTAVASLFTGFSLTAWAALGLVCTVLAFIATLLMSRDKRAEA